MSATDWLTMAILRLFTKHFSALVAGFNPLDILTVLNIKHFLYGSQQKIRVFCQFETVVVVLVKALLNS